MTERADVSERDVGSSLSGVVDREIRDETSLRGSGSRAAVPQPPLDAAARLRSRAFGVALGLWTFLFGITVPVFWLCGSPRAAIRAMTRIWVRGAMAGLRNIVGLRHVERGRANVPREPCLIVANHQSTWETFASLVLFPDVAIVAKQELLSIPVFGWFLRHSPMIVIDRKTGAKSLREMIEQSRTALAQGRSVLIFPEGTRRLVTDRVEFKRGAELLYAKLGVPVLPVAFDSGRFWSPSETSLRPGIITVSYLEPIPPGLSGTEFTRRAEEALEAAKNPPVA